MNETRQYQTAKPRRDRAVAAVVELYTPEDPAGLTTARIVRCLRLSEGALFRHFPNKDAPWGAVAGWVVGQLPPRVAALVDDVPGPRAGLKPVAAVVLCLGTVQGLVVQSLIAGEMRTPVRAAPAVSRVFGAGILEQQT